MTIYDGPQENPLNFYFAELIQRLAGPQAGPLLAEATARLSRARGEGHICLELASVAGDGDVEAVRRELAATPVVGTAGATTPLIVDGPYLYLQRYHRAETRVADFIRRRQGLDLHGISTKSLAAGLARFFPEQKSGEVDWQQVATLAALSRRFCVISGGPGTGKTTTVAKILALYLELQQKQGRVIGLAAPTGKAAARLSASIMAAKDALPISPELAGQLSHEVVTIHRLLGLADGRPRYHEDHPLAVDLLVVDEASMVDLPLMAQLMAALPAGSTLLLLGDHFQLSSVQPGAVLGDICSGGQGFTAEFAELAGQVGVRLGDTPQSSQPLADGIVTLHRSYRFSEKSGIRRLSQAVKRGQSAEALAVLNDPDCPDVEMVDYGTDCAALAAAELAPAFASLFASGDKEQRLAALSRLGVLCALRHGPAGMATINATLVGLLAESRGEAPPLYDGLPVMINRNSYGLGLFNGDTGLLVEEGGRLLACFLQDAGLRQLAARRLPPHDPAYAMTIHKSQGSEFERVVVILPPQSSPVLGRELLYTALTRARHGVQVWGSAEIFGQAVAAPVCRISGLAARLW